MKKKIVYLFFTIIICLPVCGQEFSFSLYFEDAMSNRDTLVLGYDPAATEGVDAQFGEVNMLYDPFNEEFEVRTGRLFHYIWSPDSFLVKKHIVPPICDGRSVPFRMPFVEYIYIHCKNFPLTISWDTVFNKECTDHSFLTDWNPNIWFDAIQGGEQGPFFLKDSTHIVLTHLNVYNSQVEYVSHNGANLNVIYFALCSEQNFKDITDIEEISTKTVGVYPNPVQDVLNLDTGNDPLDFVRILDLSGRIYKQTNENQVDVSALPNGVYIVELKLKNSSKLIYKKFIKGGKIY